MLRASLFFAPLLVLLACGGNGAPSNPGSGGQDPSAGAGAADSGGSTDSGGVTSTGGQAPAGGGVTSTGGQAPASGGTSDTGLVTCDLRKVACKIAQPICPENQVPSVDGACFGPCVPIESCACAAAEECPFSDRYACWQRTHCGPYVR